MRGLRIALAACMLFATPALGTAQQVQFPQFPQVNHPQFPPVAQQPRPPGTALPGKPAHPAHPAQPPHPAQPAHFPRRPIPPYNVSYPVYIDGSYGSYSTYGDHHLGDPAPKRTPAPNAKGGQDVFWTLSTEDAK